MAEQIRRRPGGRSERVRQAVIDATVAVIAETGLAGVAVNDIASRAGVHETSIYRRWGTRENLILDAASRLSEHLIPIPDTGSVRTDFHVLLRSIAAYLGSPEGKGVAQALTLGGDESRWQDVRIAFWDTRLELARAIIERAVERNELPAHTDARLALETLIAPLSFRTLVTREPIDDDLCIQLTDVVLDGLRTRADQ